MYQCSGCGGALKFDIATQNMKCEQCMSLTDPYSLHIKEGAEGSYDATIFTCPHCGGEIISTDNSLTEFCSFCGAHTILESRLCSIKKPNYIIPFSITKEDCKKIYLKHLGKSFFTPRAFKKAECIESFRGIYMPYWAYHVEQKNPTMSKAHKSYRRGDYIITDHFHLDYEVDAFYKGLSYDASSSFYDSISESIGPFNVKNMKEFHPAILSGFYGDTMDIPSEVYCSDAFEYANIVTFDAINEVPAYRHLSVEEPLDYDVRNYTLNTRLASLDSTMYPVWFMSYRNKGRVAYATINGQTGRIATDLPISGSKYILFSLIISIPVFLILTLLATFTASTTLGLSAILGMVSLIIYSCEVNAIATKDSLTDDKGIMHKKGRYVHTKITKMQHNAKKAKSIVSKILVVIFVSIFLFAFGIPLLSLLSDAIPLGVITSIIAIAVTAITLGVSSKKCKSLRQSFVPGIHILNMIAYGLSFLISAANPVSDIIYYAAVGITLIVIVCTNLSIINKRNIHATRKLPQFNKTGGDNSAWN